MNAGETWVNGKQNKISRMKGLIMQIFLFLMVNCGTRKTANFS